MKIKTKKQLNLPQLIEWAWDNGVRNVTFRGLDKKGYVVSISINDKGEFTSDWRISKNDLFTVEVEEEITEETVHTMLIVIYKHPTLRKIFSHRDNTSIRQYKELEEEDVDSFYMLNDDSTMTLIWRNGKLVE
ncbi:hypothetical protein [Staphylococcus pseudoxylosus]|uniref:hypothetical protein n=1 Tax=Staphylococcus pseudoxylosus TaxID=2282419 RepID=UPI002DB7A6AE|nr:hypothetical protein [Staphylococcus pseudoxylosus]MEB6037964.1 hypothetical protein [Staphylococcus pseudoxylosus]